jgi:hypothetical protein
MSTFVDPARTFAGSALKIEFATDSPLEEAVSSEPVSEVEEPGTREGANSGRVMDDSGIVKTLFRARISPEIVPLSLRPAPPSGH